MKKIIMLVASMGLSVSAHAYQVTVHNNLNKNAIVLVGYGTDSVTSMFCSRDQADIKAGKSGVIKTGACCPKEINVYTDGLATPKYTLSVPLLKRCRNHSYQIYELDNKIKLKAK